MKLIYLQQLQTIFFSLILTYLNKIKRQTFPLILALGG